jgi:hypothetical protein
VTFASKLRRYAFVAIPIAGVTELAAHLYFARRPPTFDEWKTLTAPVAEERRPGELVVVAPSWADPLARTALGDDAMPIRDEARPDESRYASALEVSILGETAPELRAWRPDGERRVGKFRLRHLVNPSPARVLYDFVDHVRPGDADVRITQPAADCAWNPRAHVETGGLGGHPTFPAERFQCPGGEFFHVGVTVIADQDFRPRRCIWSHPPSRGEVVTRFHGVPLGEVIRGHAGMYWIIEREKKGAPVTLTVRVDGDTVGSFVHEDGDGWKGFEMPLGAHANAKSAEVEFAVTTPNYRDRHYCFEADTR